MRRWGVAEWLYWLILVIAVMVMVTGLAFLAWFGPELATVRAERDYWRWAAGVARKAAMTDTTSTYRIGPTSDSTLHVIRSR